MKNLLLPLLLVLIAAAGIVLFVGGPDDSGTGTTPDTAPLEASYDYRIRGMLTTRFAADGRPASRLKAATVTHYPDGHAELATPEFESFGVDSAAWQVSATTGTLTPDAQRGEDRLDLQGEVALYKPQPNGDFIDAETSALTVFVDTEEALTDAPVALQTRNTRGNGVGMRALLAENHLKLNNGTVTHAPAPRP